jgi:transcriptional regulator with XRE-family HTH domain
MPRAPSDPKTMAAVSSFLTEALRPGAMTQEALAEATGLSQTTISDAKIGKKATEATVQKIAEAVGVAPEAILNGVATEALRRRAKPLAVAAARVATTPAPSLTYPNRDAVFALYAGKYDPEVFDYVAILANSGGDRSEEAWEAELVRAQGRRDRSGSPAIVATGEGIGDPGGFAALPPRAVKRRR